MFPYRSFTAWATGNFTTSITVALDRNRRYLVTGGLVGKEGGDHGQVFISTVCTMPSNDQVLCGVRDDPSDSSDTLIKNRNLVEFLQPTATRVTIKLRSRGGRHRAEGVIYDIT
jgi:hypothetical protein